MTRPGVATSLREDGHDLAREVHGKIGSRFLRGHGNGRLRPRCFDRDCGAAVAGSANRAAIRGRNFRVIACEHRRARQVELTAVSPHTENDEPSARIRRISQACDAPASTTCLRRW